MSRCKDVLARASSYGEASRSSSSLTGRCSLKIRVRAARWHREAGAGSRVLSSVRPMGSARVVAESCDSRTILCRLAEGLRLSGSEPDLLRLLRLQVGLDSFLQRVDVPRNESIQAGLLALAETTRTVGAGRDALHVDLTLRGNRERTSGSSVKYGASRSFFLRLSRPLTKCQSWSDVLLQNGTILSRW